MQMEEIWLSEKLRKDKTEKPDSYILPKNLANSHKLKSNICLFICIIDY